MMNIPNDYSIYYIMMHSAFHWASMSHELHGIVHGDAGMSIITSLEATGFPSGM